MIILDFFRENINGNIIDAFVADDKNYDEYVHVITNTLESDL